MKLKGKNVSKWRIIFMELTNSEEPSVCPQIGNVKWQRQKQKQYQTKTNVRNLKSSINLEKGK